MTSDEIVSKIVEFFKRRPGFCLIRSSVAEHCGVLYINFRATPDVIEDILRLPKWTNLLIHVYLENNELAYRMCCGNNYQYLWNVLEKINIPERQRNLLCPGCLRVWKESDLLEDHICLDCKWQLDVYQDEVE
jgi:hypothetical protein